MLDLRNRCFNEALCHGVSFILYYFSINTQKRGVNRFCDSFTVTSHSVVYEDHDSEDPVISDSDVYEVTYTDHVSECHRDDSDSDQ